MNKTILPLAADELIAVMIAAIGLFVSPMVGLSSGFLASIGGLAVIYLIICVVMRKYEMVVRKYHKPLPAPDDSPKRK